MDVSIYEPLIAYLEALKKQLPEKSISISVWDNLIHITSSEWDGWIEKWEGGETRYIEKQKKEA